MTSNGEEGTSVNGKIFLVMQWTEESIKGKGEKILGPVASDEPRSRKKAVKAGASWPSALEVMEGREVDRDQIRRDFHGKSCR